MCLIVYSPRGALLERRVFDFARTENPDGIGVMSRMGIVKFVGRKAGKRAWRYLRQIEGTPYGLHFRWATHGNVNAANCHPFQAPRSDAWVMHNGIIELTADAATDDKSDTALFVEWCMGGAPRPDTARYAEFYGRIENMIGWGNKLLVYHAVADAFTLVNDDAGDWINGLWYSNDYSLPHDMRRWGLGARASVTAFDADGFSGKVTDCYDREAYYRSLEKEPDFYDTGAYLRQWEGRQP